MPTSSTLAQRKLWSSTDPKEWKAALLQYDAAISVICKKKPKLKEMDNWYRLEFHDAIHNGSPGTKTVQHEQLLKVVDWKITRGKFRPLRHHIVKLSPSDVEAASKRAFGHMDYDSETKAKTGLSKAIAELGSLKGVGPATASAVLAAAFPAKCAFMSDEAMAAALPECSDSQRYSAARGVELTETLRTRAEALTTCPQTKQEWTPTQVERALWAAAFAPPGCLAEPDDDKSSESTKKKRHQSAADESDKPNARAGSANGNAKRRRAR